MSWVPPSGGTPVGPTPPTNASPSAASVGPDASTPVVSHLGYVAPEPAAPVSPTPPGMVRTAVLVGVIGALVAGSLIGGIGTGISNANRPPVTYDPWEEPIAEDPTTSPGDYSDLAIGDPGEPTAAEPTVCETACFDESSAEAAILDDAVFEQWSLPTYKHVWKMTGDRTMAGAGHIEAWEKWEYSGFGPDACYPTYSEAPFVEEPGSLTTDGLVAPLTEHSSELYSVTELTQWVRFFPDSDAAEDYMTTVDAALQTCTRYKDANSYPVDVVSREPALHQPDNVAAIGWVRSYAGLRYYVFDMQRGNMVIRSVAYSDGGISDSEFRPLMAEQAVVLSQVPLSG